MTEVTTMRMHSAGRIHPLGDLKNNHIYQHKPQYDSRVTNSASAAIRGENTPRNFRNMKDGFQQAALINIVASVNNENKQRPVTSADSVKNTMNCISTLFLPKNRQISIPKPQAFMEVPQKFSKKKPLFNKKSGHQVTEKEIENRKRNISLSRPRPSSRDPELTSKQESIKITVSLQRVSDEMNESDGSREWISSPSKVRLARSNSPRHRYISLKKKPEQRATTAISTCEAIDILDATEAFNQSKQQSVSSTRDNVTSPSQDSNLYRAKSLPALFPVKRRKSVETTQNGASGEKKHNIHPFKRTSVKAYGGMPNLLVGKTCQAKLNEEVENIDDSTKPLFKPSNKTNEHYLKFIHREDKSKEKVIVLNKENITLLGRSIPNPRPSSIQLQRHSRHPETDMLYSSFENLEEKKLVKQLDRQFEDLRKNISAKMSNLSDGGSVASELSSDITSYNLVGKAFKSNLSTTSSVSKNGKHKNKKRVTFAEDTEESIAVCDKAILNYDNDRALLNARLMQTKYHFKEKDRDREIHQMKPISEVEMVRLKQRLVPDTHHGDTKHQSDFVDDIHISGMLVPGVRSSSRASDTNRSVISEADTIGIEEAAKEWNGVDIDATNRDRTEIPLSQGASSFYPTEQDEDFDSCESDEEDIEHLDSYRVVKAIDLGKLSNFQHRKFKKVQHKHDPSTTHFVKIKVK